MAKKYYAVRSGITPGIYESWDECKAQVHGFPSAEYKSFKTLIEAERFMGKQTAGQEKKQVSDADTLIAYVDGSYNVDTKEFSYGIVYLAQGEESYDSRMVPDKELAEMRNVAGEIKGAETAMRYALEHGFKKLVIYHDYEGIAKWCTGDWRTNKEGTKAYSSYYSSIKDQIQIQFIKVKGHSNDKYNDMADQLAKQAIF